MARWPRFAAAGSPGTSSVRTKATKVIPSPRRTRAASRRLRNLRKRRDGSRGRHPAASFWLAADAADVNRPGRVVVGAAHALGGSDHLARLDQREEGSIGVELPLNLLEQLPTLGVVGGRSRLGAQCFQARVSALGPAGSKSDELSWEKDEVIVGVRVVGSPEPQAELFLARAVFSQRDRDRAASEVDLDSDLLQIRLDLLGERAEGETVEREIARKAEVDCRVRDSGGGELRLGLGEIALGGVRLRQRPEKHARDKPRCLDGAGAG